MTVTGRVGFGVWVRGSNTLSGGWLCVSDAGSGVGWSGCVGK